MSKQCSNVCHFNWHCALTIALESVPRAGSRFYILLTCILHFLRLSSAVLAKVGEEVAALQASAAAATAAAAEAGGEEGAAGTGVSELLKPARESAAVLKEVWNPMVSKACAQGKCLVCPFRV
jgi:hypothetical protein